MTWEVVSVICALILLLVVLVFTKSVEDRDPRGNALEVDIYIKELEAKFPVSIEKIDVRKIAIHQTIYSYTIPRVSGGIWGTIANTQSKYQEEHSGSLYECMLIVQSSKGELNSPPLKTSRIALEFFFDEIEAIDVLWFSTKEGDKGLIDIRPVVEKFG